MNIKPANRINSVTEYYFSRKLKEIQGMRESGCDVINLGIGSPDLPPSLKTIEKLNEVSQQKDAHGYQGYMGVKQLREAFAHWYKKYYLVDLDPEKEILPLIGSKEGILYVSLAYLNPGDEVLVPNPGYPTYRSVSNLLETKIIEYELDETNNWQPDFHKLEKKDLSNVKLMWVNYPNMPTGANASKELFSRIINFGKKHNILICNDNPYSFILNDKPLSIFSIDGAKDIALELNSLSKSHNMAGWRIGGISGNPYFIQTILKVNSNVHSGIFKSIQMAAIEALNNPGSWYTHNNSIYKARRDIVCEIMHEMQCEYDDKQTGMFMWGKVPERFRNGEELSELILNKAHVFITPGFIFGSKGEKYIRISLCTDKMILQVAKDRILKIFNNNL